MVELPFGTVNTPGLKGIRIRFRRGRIGSVLETIRFGVGELPAKVAN